MLENFSANALKKLRKPWDYNRVFKKFVTVRVYWIFITTSFGLQCLISTVQDDNAQKAGKP